MPPAADDSPSVPPRRRRRAGALQWLHAVALFAFVVLFKIGADNWGWATVLAYGPRWPWLVPGVLVMLGALLFRRRAWLTIVVTLAYGLWLLDVRVPLPHFGRTDTRLRVFTLNADGGETAGRGTDLARIGRLIAETRPDVIFLQEYREPNPPPLPPGDWNVRRDGSRMIVTRLPVDSVASLEPKELLNESSVFGCRVEVEAGRKVWLFTPHLETPRRGFTHLLRGQRDALELTDKLVDRRQTVSERATQWITDLAGDRDVVIGGDFNQVGDGRIFRTTWAAKFADAFETAGWGTGGTKLQNVWRPRIDHVMTGTGWRATRCVVGADVGSDHLPLIADVAIVVR